VEHAGQAILEKGLGAAIMSGRKKSLRDLTRMTKDNDDFRKAHREIWEGTDRASALVAGAAIDQALFGLLKCDSPR
jgi:hypothetical protein